MSTDAQSLAAMPVPEAQQFYFNQALNELKDSAKLATANALYIFQLQQAAAKENNQPPPTSYIVTSVDVPMLTRLFAGAADENDSMQKVLVESRFTPAPPPHPTALPVPAGFPIGISEGGNLYGTLDVAPLPVYPNGAIWPVEPLTDPRGRFLKHLYETPFGYEGNWVKIA